MSALTQQLHKQQEEISELRKKLNYTNKKLK